MIYSIDSLSSTPYNNNNIYISNSNKGISYHIDFYLYDNGGQIFFSNFLPFNLLMESV
jgi:hypothetical protein